MNSHSRRRHFDVTVLNPSHGDPTMYDENRGSGRSSHKAHGHSSGKKTKPGAQYNRKNRKNPADPASLTAKAIGGDAASYGLGVLGAAAANWAIDHTGLSQTVKGLVLAGGSVGVGAALRYTGVAPKAGMALACAGGAAGTVRIINGTGIDAKLDGLVSSTTQPVLPDNLKTQFTQAEWNRFTDAQRTALAATAPSHGFWQPEQRRMLSSPQQFAAPAQGHAFAQRTMG